MEFSVNELIKWAGNIDRYFMSSEDQDDSVSNTGLFKAYLDTIAEILTEIAHKTTHNDHWELFFMGNVLEIRSKKLEHGFRFGTWLDIEFNMETGILFPQHISYMPDEFWKHVLELKEYGKFVFMEDSMPDFLPCSSLQAPKKVKSNLFRLARHCVLFGAQEDENSTNGKDIYDDFGSLEVSWPLNIKIEDLLNNMSEVFTRFYRINYMLYRHEYIITHSKHKEGRKMRTRDEVDDREQR